MSWWRCSWCCCCLTHVQANTKPSHTLIGLGSVDHAAAVALPRKGDPNFPKGFNNACIKKKQKKTKQQQRKLCKWSHGYSLSSTFSSWSRIENNCFESLTNFFLSIYSQNCDCLASVLFDFICLCHTKFPFME